MDIVLVKATQNKIQTAIRLANPQAKRKGARSAATETKQDTILLPLIPCYDKRVQTTKKQK
ncbi:hypothetical protein GF373_11235 [bacterium]|nr:hypothetical protein [bacterium]